MTKHRVSELEGMLLDAAVAKAEGFDYFNPPPDREGWAPSRGWEVGGPIIERERIEVGPSEREDVVWFACLPKSPKDFNVGAWGETALIAAMRAYVSSKFGKEVELP